MKEKVKKFSDEVMSMREWLMESLRMVANRLVDTGYIKSFRLDSVGRPADIVWTVSGNSLRYHLRKLYGGAPGQPIFADPDEVEALLILVSDVNLRVENN